MLGFVPQTNLPSLSFLALTKLYWTTIWVFFPLGLPLYRSQSETRNDKKLLTHVQKRFIASPKTFQLLQIA